MNAQAKAANKKFQSYCSEHIIQGVNIMDYKVLINRINELAHKKKSEGLTPEELIEQKKLYAIYLDGIRTQLKNQLDNIEVVDELPKNQH